MKDGTRPCVEEVEEIYLSGPLSGAAQETIYEINTSLIGERAPEFQVHLKGSWFSAKLEEWEYG